MPHQNTPHSHGPHLHQHGPGCGHTPIKHEGHVDYLHDGHLHHQTPQGVEEHRIAISDKNPDQCNPVACDPNQQGHVHGPGCGHERIPHGDHIDYLVNGRLIHPHGDHCDDHGPVDILQTN